MAIQTRRGNEVDFDKNKLLPGETATALDTKKIFHAFAPGDIHQMATVEEMSSAIENVTDDIRQDFTEGVEIAINTANAAASNATTQATYAKNQGDYAKAQGDYAKAQGQAAESVVLGKIATTTTAGIVKGGGNVTISADGQMNVDLTAKLDKTGDSKDCTVSFTQASTLANVVSGESHGSLFGKIAKFFSFIGTTALTTAAQTVSGAINELVSYTLKSTDPGTSISDLNGFLEFNKMVGFGNTTLNRPPGMDWGKVMNMGYSAGIFNQYAYSQTGITFVRKYVDWDTPKWGDWKQLLSTADLVNTDTQNVVNKPLAANVGYTLGQEIDTINSVLNKKDIIPDTRGYPRTPNQYPIQAAVYEFILGTDIGLPEQYYILKTSKPWLDESANTVQEATSLAYGTVKRRIGWGTTWQAWT